MTQVILGINIFVLIIQGNLKLQIPILLKALGVGYKVLLQKDIEREN